MLPPAPPGLPVGSALQRDANIFRYSILHMRRWGDSAGEDTPGAWGGWRRCEEAAMLWGQDGMYREREDTFVVQKGFDFRVWMMVGVVKASSKVCRWEAEIGE